MIARNYKGIVTLTELKNMGAADINLLYKFALDRNKTEQGKAEIENEAIEEVIDM